ncbi:MAG: hypothetical protein L3J07_02380 [Candidatus Magasanikbacteria bacterium]|nr:hypothetical protein [Candidatus Magasanikbacteria bacterium]
MRVNNHNKNHAMRDEKLKARKWFMTKTTRALLFCLIAFFGIMYLGSVNSVATKGYQIADLEKQLVSLERENDKLSFEISQYRSMHSIQDRLQELEMIPISKIDYVDVTAGVFARR